MGSLVHVKEATVITPSNHTPSSTLPLSSLDSQLFLRFTIEYLLIYPPISLSISQSLSTTLKSSLSRALTPYFPLSGRVQERKGGRIGSLEVNCCNQGALFLEAESNFLASLDFTKAAPRQVTSWRKLLSLNVVDVLAGAPPLVVQLTWLRDGGAALAIGVNHCVTDGIGSAEFLSLFSELARDKLSRDELKRKHVWDRHLLIPRVCDSLSHHHELDRDSVSQKHRQLSPIRDHHELTRDSLSQTESKRKHLWDRHLLNPRVCDSLSHHNELDRDSLSQKHRQLLNPSSVRDSLNHHHELDRDSLSQTESKRKHLWDRQLPLINHPEFNRVPDLCGFVNRFNVERLVPTSIVFEKQRLNELKKLASRLSESNSKYHTSFEVLSAHVWRSWARSLNLPSNQIVKLLFSINIRDRVKPSLPKGFYGNAFVVGCAQTTVKDLTEKGLSYATSLVKQAKDRVDDGYVRSVVEAVSDSKTSPDLVGVLILSQWSRLGLEKLDFGLGKPIHLGSVCCDRYCLFLPVPGKSDAVKVMVAVPSSAVDTYENLVISPND